MINLEMDEVAANAVREVLQREANLYTEDPTCTPVRILAIRSIIDQLKLQTND